MTTENRAKDYFDNHYNCAQSVLKSLESFSGLSNEIAEAVSFGFGGGVRCKEICGAISGGVIAINCSFYSTDKDKAKELTKEFITICKNKFNGVRCEDLKSNKAIPCRELVSFAAKTAEQLLLERSEFF